MSVIAWDGKTLAVDKQATCSAMPSTVSKARRLPNGEIVAWTGDQEQGLVLADWYETGAHVSNWPEFQKDREHWARLVVAGPSGIRFYEQFPVEQVENDPFQAFGSGRDYAMGALAMGATAEQAVLVASRFNIHCGMGVDVFHVLPHGGDGSE